MKTLHIAIVDKIATYQQRDGEIVCGNSDYVIEFAFDSEWDEHTDKVARFIIGNHYENVSFSGNTCPVPVITNTTSISVGVYAGNLCTTTPAIIGCKKSILCATAAEGKSPVLNGDSAYIRYSAYADGTDFTEEWREDQNYIGFATGQTAPTTKEGYKWALFTQGTVDSELSETSENPIQNRAVAEALKNVSANVTVDSELSLTSENPVQNKVIKAAFDSTNRSVSSIFQRQEEMGNHLDSLQNQVDNMGGGGSGGVSSWNDLTDKPFGENEDGTVKQLDNKYLEPFELQAGDVNEFLPSYTAANIFNSSLSAFNIVVSTDEATYNAFLENTKPMVIVYDGVEYICEVHTLQGTKYLGNGVSLGGAGNNEPFAIMCHMSNTGSENAYYWLVVSTVDTASTEHTVRVYQSTPDKWLLKEQYLPDGIGGAVAQPVSIDLSGLDTNGTIVETYADGTTKTTTMEFDENGNPIKITDGDGNVTTLTW